MFSADDVDGDYDDDDENVEDSHNVDDEAVVKNVQIWQRGERWITGGCQTLTALDIIFLLFFWICHFFIFVMSYPDNQHDSILNKMLIDDIDRCQRYPT